MEDADIEEVVESDDEGILQDDQEIDDDGALKDEEGLTDKERAPPTPLSSPCWPDYQPYLHNGRDPYLKKTPRVRIPPVHHLDHYAHVSRTTCGQLGISQLVSQTCSTSGGSVTFHHFLRLMSLLRFAIGTTQGRP